MNEKIVIFPLVVTLQECYECQKKQKTPTKQDFLVWCATFHPNLRKHQKPAIKLRVFFIFMVIKRFLHFGWKVAHQFNLS